MLDDVVGYLVEGSAKMHLGLFSVAPSSWLQKPKRYLLTPWRKLIGKAIACKNLMTTEALKNSSTRDNNLKILGKQICDEIKVMSSDQTDSILRSKNSDLLKQFNWKLLLSELKLHAPLLASIYNSVTKRKSAYINNCNSRMNLVQKFISLLLYAAGTSKQVSMLLYSHF